MEIAFAFLMTMGVLAMMWVNGHFTLGLLQDILAELKKLNEGRKP